MQFHPVRGDGRLPAKVGVGATGARLRSERGGSRRGLQNASDGQRRGTLTHRQGSRVAAGADLTTPPRARGAL